MRSDIWLGKKVLITGHTGFKGAWLTLILHGLGASVYGLALKPEEGRSFYSDVSLASFLSGEFIGDIRDESFLDSAFKKVEFDYVFHLAAQSLVIRSYKDPLETITTNVVGTANVLAKALTCDTVRGISVITTDKVYRNEEWVWPYRENDQLGGKDVYSASKAAVEITVWPLVNAFNKNSIPVSTLRAGNVIGGGDWAENRLIPDLIRASITGTTLEIRNPKATRPWQHVFDCLNGYLLLAERHLNDPKASLQSINFGPKDDLSVEGVISIFSKSFAGMPNVKIVANTFAEHQSLVLDSSLARNELGWAPKFSVSGAVSETADWYMRYLSGDDTRKLSLNAIERYGFE